MSRSWCASPFFVSLMAMGYFACVFDQIDQLEDPPRAFPYPDAWLLPIHDWLDGLRPAPPGSIKLHGEIELLKWGVFSLVGLSLLMAVIFAFLWFRHVSRETAGCCAHCDFDLRGSMGSTTCPECGAAVVCDAGRIEMRAGPYRSDSGG